MRIVAGRLGGRLFDSPGTNRTHPMSDKARGALFNMLGDLAGLTVLDAFAGTGALSLEAVSRGAAHALAIESDKAAQQTIKRNIQSLEVDDQVELIAATANAWMLTNETARFDVVLCDPPYDDLQHDLLKRLAGRTTPGGIFVLSWPGSEDAPVFKGLQLLEQRSHGDLQLIFYRNVAAA